MNTPAFDDSVTVQGMLQAGTIQQHSKALRFYLKINEDLIEMLAICNRKFCNGGYPTITIDEISDNGMSISLTSESTFRGETNYNYIYNSLFIPYSTFDLGRFAITAYIDEYIKGVQSAAERKRMEARQEELAHMEERDRRLYEDLKKKFEPKGISHDRSHLEPSS